MSLLKLYERLGEIQGKYHFPTEPHREIGFVRVDLWRMILAERGEGLGDEDGAVPPWEASVRHKAGATRETRHGETPGWRDQCHAELATSRYALEVANYNLGTAKTREEQLEAVVAELRDENERFRDDLTAHRTYDESCAGTLIERTSCPTIADLVDSLPAGHSVTFTAPDWKGEADERDE